MTISEAVISGIVQGATEFFPVSSSAHLVFLHNYFEFSKAHLFFDISLHVATLCALLLYFRADIAGIIKGKQAWILYIAFGSIPAVFAGLFFKNYIEVFFASPQKTAFMLVITGIVLFLGQFWFKKSFSRQKDMNLRAAFMVGMAQMIALLPGISRSGVTLSAGLYSGIKTEQVFRFSFLLSVPVILGGALYEIFTSGSEIMNEFNFVNYASGMTAAFISGLIGLHLLWKIIKSKKLFIFGIYCITIGIGGVFFWR